MYRLLVHSLCTNKLKKHNKKLFYCGTSLGNNLIVLFYHIYIYIYIYIYIRSEVCSFLEPVYKKFESHPCEQPLFCQREKQNIYTNLTKYAKQALHLRKLLDLPESSVHFWNETKYKFL